MRFRPGQLLLLTCLCLGLAACASPDTKPSRDLDEALAELGKKPPLAVYNEAVRQVALHVAEDSLLEAKEDLAEEGVDLVLPPAKLSPTKLLVLPSSPTDPPQALGAPVAIEYSTRGMPLLPPEGMFVSGTAIYERAAPPARPRFAIVTGMATASLPGLPPDLPLRANYSEPYRILSERARPLAKSGFSGMIAPGRPIREAQFYLMEPYDRKKITLLMVHGLQSTPVAFMPLIYALREDPVVRARYQVWHFHYATGTPVIVNSLILRNELAETIKAVDPDDNDPATHHMVVLGHSMGGVISHTLVSTSGDQLWNSIFTAPPSGLEGDRELIDWLYRGMTFQANPRITRAIFMSSPHHGSPVADSLAGRAGRILTRLPPQLLGGLNDLARLNPHLMTPAGFKFYNGSGFSSIRTLSRRSPALMTLADLPIQVPFHSIMGQRRPGPKEEGSDGVVPYASAHLPGAASELVVRGGHNIFEEPEAQAEVLRILREEVGSPP